MWKIWECSEIFIQVKYSTIKYDLSDLEWFHFNFKLNTQYVWGIVYSKWKLPTIYVLTYMKLYQEYLAAF